VGTLASRASNIASVCAVATKAKTGRSERWAGIANNLVAIGTKMAGRRGWSATHREKPRIRSLTSQRSKVAVANPNFAAPCSELNFSRNSSTARS